MNKLENIEHSTFNIERQMIRLTILDWKLSVECWALNVFDNRKGGRA